MINDADVDSANPEILTVKEDEDDDEDDDGEIFKGSQYMLFYVSSELDSILI